LSDRSSDVEVENTSKTPVNLPEPSEEQKSQNASNCKEWVEVPQPCADKFGNKLYKCYVGDCTTTYKNRASMRKHLRKHKLKGDPVKMRQGFNNQREKISDAEVTERYGNLPPLSGVNVMKSINCKECRRELPANTSDVMEHLKGHIRAERAGVPYIPEPIYDKKSDEWKCTDCPKSYKNRSHCRSHIRFSHIEVGDHPCPECDKSFSNEIRLQTHQKHNHNQPKDKICPNCAKAFRNEKSLKRHLKSHATGPFPCQYCDQQFDLKTECYYHERRVHRGWVPYVCDICSKAFVSESHLNRHKLFHYNNRAFPCEHCGKSFFYKDSLENHQTPGAGMPCRGLQKHCQMRVGTDTMTSCKVMRITDAFDENPPSDYAEDADASPEKKRRKLRNRRMYTKKPVSRIRYLNLISILFVISFANYEIYFFLS